MSDLHSVLSPPGVDIQSKTNGKLLYAYYGLPFAEPPVGQLRFRPPAPYNGRDPDRVISSSGFRESCFQFPPAPNPMSEDCLHLNVFVPPSSSQTLKKVMVWVHGGGFTGENVQPYKPTDLVADYDVIVVTFHYRLGYLGFLSTGDEASPGNYGLRDQVMALKWVKDNIRAFGGDADDVTVFGESAGSLSVSLLSLSPLASGLFTKVVMQSGSALAPYTVQERERSLEEFYKLAQRLDCLPWYYHFTARFFIRSAGHESMVNCMRGKPVELVIPAIGRGSGRFMDVSHSVYARPTVDGEFLPKLPRVLLNDPNYLQQNGVLSRSYVSGHTNNEAAFLFNLIVGKNFNVFATDANMRSFAEDNAKFFFPLGVNQQAVDMVDFLYSYPRDANDRPTFQNFVDLWTDSFYAWPNLELITLLSEKSPSTPIYQYLFDHFPDLLDKNATKEGTGHGFDILYLFDDDHHPLLDGILDLTTRESRTMKEVFRSSLAAFAKTGVPSVTSNGVASISWPRFDNKDRMYIALSPNSQQRKRVFSQRMSLWQDYLPKVVPNYFRRG